MSKDTITAISVTRTRIYHRGGNRRFPFTFSYEAVGPDGKRWDGDSLPALRSRLKRHYGPATRLVDGWRQ